MPPGKIRFFGGCGCALTEKGGQGQFAADGIGRLDQEIHIHACLEDFPGIVVFPELFLAVEAPVFFGKLPGIDEADQAVVRQKNGNYSPLARDDALRGVWGLFLFLFDQEAQFMRSAAAKLAWCNFPRGSCNLCQNGNLFRVRNFHAGRRRATAGE